MIEIFNQLLDKYITPIIKFSDCYFDNKTGEIKPIGELTKVYKFENKKYSENDNSTDIPQYITPIKIYNDYDYLSLKDDPKKELFNPFTNTKHITLVALLVKDKLNEYFQNNDNHMLDEDFEDNIYFYNNNEEDGKISLVFAIKNKKKEMEEIIKVTDEKDNITYLTWLLCIETIKYCGFNLPKEFNNPEKTWKSIMKQSLLWNKQRKSISSQVKEESELTYIDFEEKVDLKDYKTSDYVNEEDIDKYFEKKFSNNITESNTIDDLDLSDTNGFNSLSKNSTFGISGDIWDDIEFI